LKERTLDGFGDRLAELRQRRGLTQTALGAAVGVSKRVIAYYEADGAQRPGAMLVDLARALKVSADELLGLTPLRDTPSPKVARLLKRVERLAELPDAEQRAVLKVVDGFLDSYSPAKPRRRAAPPPRPKRKAS
jgi:transcriptional regulator with XRE-family HTH domain